MKELYNKALQVAHNFSVATPKDGIVVYSVSYQVTKENREKAWQFTAQHPDKMVIEHTDCGAKLVEMGLLSSDCGLTDEEIAEIWSIASKRFISNGSGEVTAFVKNADPRSVFCRMELPHILANDNLTSINGIDKHKFAQDFKK